MHGFQSESVVSSQTLLKGSLLGKLYKEAEKEKMKHKDASLCKVGMID